MTQRTDRDREAEERAGTRSADEEPRQAPQEEAEAGGEGEDEPTPEDPVRALRRENEELRERWMRAQADYKNLRRRGLEDLEKSLQRSLRPLLEELLLVLDFLELALASPTTTDESRNLATGIEMTRTKFLQALESAEVHPIPGEGRFDPALHEATGTRPAEEVEPGTILETTRRGYTWRGSVLRPAHVVVAADDEEGVEDEGNEAAGGRDEER